MILAHTPLITLARMTSAERGSLIIAALDRLAAIQERIDALQVEKAAYDSDPTRPLCWSEAHPEESEQLLDLPQLLEIETRAITTLKRIDFN